jgi:ribosomal protein L28
MKSFDYKFPLVAHIGHNVSHAKNRTARSFKRNLHTVTVMVDGEKKRYKVPTKVLRLMKKQGATTHWQKPEEEAAAK